MGTVMVADDEEKVVALVEATFSGDDRFRLVIARDGDEAVQVARRERPDLIFLDVLMPKQDGYRVCKALKSDTSTARAKIIMLTALAQDLDKERASEAGADGYLTKPFSPLGLIKVVERTLGPLPA